MKLQGTWDSTARAHRRGGRVIPFSNRVATALRMAVREDATVRNADLHEGKCEAQVPGLATVAAVREPGGACIERGNSLPFTVLVFI